MMKLSVVIVNYNVKHYLHQCVRSVLRAIEGMEAEVIVVDNHSADGSAEYLRRVFPAHRYPMLRVVGSAHNLGFARANNIAIRQSSGQYVLLLNPDTIVGEGVLAECAAFMDAHADAGAVGVRMLNAAGDWAMESRRGLPTPMVSLFKMLGLCRRWPRHRWLGRYYMGFLSWHEPARIEVVSGAFCMLRREALDRVGLLDEDFFMYGEDIDLSYRLLKGGYHNYFLPLDILHYKGESTQKSSFRYVHVFYEAMLIFFRKHYAGMSALLSVPIKAAIYARALVALAGMLAGRVRKSLGFFAPDEEVGVRYLFVGGDEMLARCRALSLRVGLDAQFLPASGVGELQQAIDRCGPAAVCLVLDADLWGYARLLSILSGCRGRGVKLGTYSRDIGMVITERSVMGEPPRDSAI